MCRKTRVHVSGLVCILLFFGLDLPPYYLPIHYIVLDEGSMKIENENIKMKIVKLFFVLNCYFFHFAF